MIGYLSTNHPFSISRNSNALGLFAWQTEWESWPIRKCSHCHSDPFDYAQNKRREASRFQQGGILRCLKMTRTRVKLSDRLLFCPDCKPHGTTKKIPNFIGGNGKFLLLFFFYTTGCGSVRQEKKKLPHKYQTTPSGFSGEKWVACKRAGTSFAYNGGYRSGRSEVRSLAKGHAPGCR